MKRHQKLNEDHLHNQTVVDVIPNSTGFNQDHKIKRSSSIKPLQEKIMHLIKGGITLHTVSSYHNFKNTFFMHKIKRSPSNILLKKKKKKIKTCICYWLNLLFWTIVRTK